MNQSTKMIHYKLANTIIDIVDQKHAIINMVVKYYSLFEQFFSNRGLLFISKF